MVLQFDKTVKNQPKRETKRNRTGAANATALPTEREPSTYRFFIETGISLAFGKPLRPYYFSGAYLKTSHNHL